mgnify:FL=1
MKDVEICDCNIIHEAIVNQTKEKMLDNDFINEISLFFKILGDNTRVKILFALDNNEMCVCDIANVLNMTKSSISHQLSFLKQNNIVKCNRVGKEVYYSLDDEHVKEVFEVAISHIKHRKDNL